MAFYVLMDIPAVLLGFGVYEGGEEGKRNEAKEN